MGIDDYELVQLAGAFTPDTDLWRALANRMTVVDLNLPYISVGVDPTAGKVRGGCGERGADPLRCQLQIQTAFQSVGIVELEVAVAGKRFRGSFTPTPDLTYTFLGRPGQLQTHGPGHGARHGADRLHLPVFYARRPDVAQAFGLPCSPPPGQSSLCLLPAQVVTGARGEETFVQAITTSLGTLDAMALGMGGFTLDVQHVYDPIGGVLYQGDGTRRATGALPLGINTVAGTGSQGTGPFAPVVDGVSALLEPISTPGSIAFAPDGSYYVSDARNIIRSVALKRLVFGVALLVTLGARR